MNYVTVPLAVVFAVAIMPHGADVYALTINVEAQDGLTKDAMFTGGATILGLVVFGSLLNVLITSSLKPIHGKRAVTGLAFGVASGAIGSLSLMWTACCAPRVDIGLYFSIILLSVSGVTILLWIAHAFDVLTNRKRDRPKDSE